MIEAAVCCREASVQNIFEVYLSVSSNRIILSRTAADVKHFERHFFVACAISLARRKKVWWPQGVIVEFRLIWSIVGGGLTLLKIITVEKCFSVRLTRFSISLCVDTENF
ncbi:MAG: hypothetical protein ABL888_14545 [Pirellulaceae bacterium]